MENRKQTEIAGIVVSKMLLGYEVSPYLNKLMDYSYITFKHSVITGYLTAYILLAKRQNLEQKMFESIVKGALLHDIGKIYVPYAILDKHEKLTDTEYEVMKIHPDIGNKMYKGRAWDTDEVIENIIMLHHERSDGSGYPNGFAEPDIPWYVHLVSAVDVYEALTSERNYGRSHTREEAAVILNKQGFNKTLINDLAEIDLG